MTPETPENRLKRIKMRSWRRGTKEMDLLLGPWADANLAQLSERDLQLYDSLLLENDQDLMAWIIGQSPTPEHFSALLNKISYDSRKKRLNSQTSDRRFTKCFCFVLILTLRRI